MAIKINFVFFERTFKVIYEDLYNFFVPCLVFDQKQGAVRHLGIIIDPIN
jgi:hypothetical protein